MSNALRLIMASGGGVSGPDPGLSDSLDSVSGESASYETRTVDISGYANSDVKVVFAYVNGTAGTNFYDGDIQLDDINIGGNSYSFESNNQSWETTTTDTLIADYSTASFSAVPDEGGNATDLAWNRHTGNTGSTATGNLGADDGSYFLYAETSSPTTFGDGFILRSPTISLGSSPTFNYAVGREGPNIGTLNVYLDVQ